MSEDKKVKTNNSQAGKTDKGAAKTVAKDLYGGEKRKSFRGRKGDSRRNNEPRDEFEQRILEIARVTRVMAGGKRMNFRACVAIGDKKGSVGVGLGKGADVTIAINKAVNRAKKTLIKVPIVKDTIPHEIYNKLGAAKIMLKPAQQGRGVISGGVIRAIVDLAGIKNITSKTLGTNNKVNNARCTIDALSKLRKVEVVKEKTPEVKPVENKEEKKK
ncbi:MAG: 30S ribosomal protein S5 [Patescibacteria group bacterium]|jgi:small subunit ribosomal protein S5|nr:30S ribosomal protein S5 [Patescibacteria group bacterium]MDD3778239.1 30S ribosomal protein S5 [Patescibacteria group bacterium]MDD3939303.1 30S ribosomal protein S5 [Patescibacteria group bacterium]MDD4443941.1 30S ribosomal protein S5 [Patescibacteria group bacterium]NCU39528.1 30S ribosomal protein S5 [Candidatus Falkowbacteria bacterium]